MKAKKIVRTSWELLRDSFKKFSNDNVVKLSAALAYYTVFSLAPMLIVIIGIGSIFYGREAMEGQIFDQIKNIVGAETAQQIQEILRKSALKSNNFFAAAIGLITLLAGAGGMFGEIQDSINMIWGLKADPKKGFMNIVVNRITSFSMVLVLGFILLVSLVFNALLESLFKNLNAFLPESLISKLYVLDYAVMISVIALFFACVFKVLPDARIKWKDIWLGAFVTSGLFLLGEYIIAYYLAHYAGISSYGAAGSMIVLLLWVYYSSIILYFGAEFTQVYVRFRGRRIEPSRYAVWIERQEIPKDSNTDIHSSAA
jgi:membrane protein